ncbi:hypothetical protein VPH35_011312 [Triticum aestivum]|uniref:uncharacterized protein n=1 Tax=Triticum aestivum TaxID=4565 RepID=UPI00084395A3|nr:uncharacterized protein LOC123081771 [Triticum aestivum]
MALAWVEDCVNWLSSKVFRIVPLLSLLMYLILAVFSDSRRREDRGWKRGLLWLAYQLTEWGPAYVIGNLYLETKPCDKMIIAFWVPFLLLHNARPDNISAYTIEDNDLWLRVIVFVPLQSLGSILIVHRYILSNCNPGLLRQATFIMLPLGLFKYIESGVALWLCGMSRIRRSFRKQQPLVSIFRNDDGVKNLKDEEALLVAHDLFEICKGAFCDYTGKMDHNAAVRSSFSGQWQNMCKVVEMELSLMYDIFYTKAAVVHTWPGYLIRLASPLLTATALLLFGLQCKEGMKTEDEVISYILLGTTFLLDVRWLLRALASSWTHSYFKLMQHNWLKHEFWCRGGWKKLRHIVLSLRLSRLSLCLWTCVWANERKSYRRWAGKFGQHNLLDHCTVGRNRYKHRHNLYGHLRSSGREIPNNTKKLVFRNICEHLFPDRVAHPEQSSVTVGKDRGGQSVYPPELQEAILIWHIATDVFLLCSPSWMTGTEDLATAIKQMSNYMMFLVTKRTKMLPGLIVRDLYKKTLDKLEKIRVKAATEGCATNEELAKWMTKEKSDFLKHSDTSDTIWDGTQLARVLLRRVLGDRQDEVSVATLEEVKGTAERLAYWLPDFSNLTIGDMEGVLLFILNAWVRVLVFASIRCSRDAHARQLSCGGELTTLVWIITQHAEVSVVKKHFHQILHRRSPSNAKLPGGVVSLANPYSPSVSS